MDSAIPNSFHYNLGFITEIHFDRPFSSIHEYNMYPSSRSSNSQLDEPDTQQIQINDERKKRRIVSNRESARRSRMRKQRRVEDLCSQVMCLRNENHKLVDKLSRMSECHDKALQENIELKGETSDLQQMFSTLQVLHPYNTLRSMEEFPSNTDHYSFESLSDSSSNYADILDWN